MKSVPQNTRNNPMMARKRRKEIDSGSRNGPVSSKKRRGRFASVDCAIHGTVRGLTKKAEVYMGSPATKREAHSGCPMCRTQPARINRA